MSTTSKNESGIAIIGMAGRFPKARSIDEFWSNLCQGMEGISFFTDEELTAAGLDFPKADVNYVKACGLLEDADLFDARFFEINPREAEVMDPQHRVFLECAWEALEHAGCDPAKYPGAIGVFAGMSMNTYLARNLLANPELTAQLNEHQLMLGNDKDFLPSRVAYKLNLRGPAVNIQTACSTSLVAVCTACQNLLAYECDAALAGAVSITFPQKRGHYYQPGGIVSPDGHCRPFDARAAGTVAGQGAAVVVLKRLADALADGNTIYAVIKGFAMNNDGSNKIGYTAPSVEAQAEVIASAQAMADITPDTITYIEAHGTGTPLGDPIEIEGLTKAFRDKTEKKQFCAIGALKSNVGHLDVAAGVAGLIKTALALHHKKIPANLHFESPNPKIDFANSPFFVNAKLAEWTNGAVPRRAGISSFGIGGTNAHLVLEEAPPRRAQAKSRPAQLVLLSAKSENALKQATRNLSEHLKQNPGIEMADVAFTLQVGRREFPHRRMLGCRGTDEAVRILEGRDDGQYFDRLAQTENPPIVFMFSGQGAQQVNMARGLYEREKTFKEIVNSCSAVLEPHLGFDLRKVVYPDATQSKEAACQLTQTAVTQPALFVIEYALARLWMSWGIQPAAMIGHSIGEYVAACLAGVLSLESALALVAARGKMMQTLPAGTMLAVRLPESELRPLLSPAVALAAVNSPSSGVVSGPVEIIQTLHRDLQRRGVASTPLLTSHAFHSAMMDPMLAPFTELVGKFKLSAPRIPFVSNVTGSWISDDEATDPNYWAKHLRHTVRFADGVAELLKEPARVFLEVGPGLTLGNLTKQHPARSADTLIVSSLRHAEDHGEDLKSVLTALGHLWLAGVPADWKAFYQGERRYRVPLPTYPFERSRFWIEPKKRVQIQTRESTETQSPDRDDDGGEVIKIKYVSPDTPPSRQRQIVDALRGLLCELSGLSPAAINANVRFTDMGLESLFLAQFSIALKKQFGVAVAFRQLLEEFQTLDALAAHFERAGCRNGSAQAIKQDSEPGELEKNTKLALTAPQHELWFASQTSDAASCAYNECRLLHLRGLLNTESLLAGMKRLAGRHEALRSTFASNGDFQKIDPALDLRIPIADWSQFESPEQERQLDAAQEEEAQRPFDLTRGPLLRGKLIRLGELHHVLMLTAHHIVCDGHSLGILLHELGEIYTAGCNRKPAVLRRPLQFSEYIRDMTRRPECAASAADEDFWLKQYENIPPALELPADHPRASAQTFDGALESRLLSARLVESVKKLSGQSGGTLFTTMLASCTVLLHKLAGQDEIVVGIPIADRAMASGEGLVGHCINFVPLRIRLNESDTFAQQLDRTQKVFFDAYEHRFLTFGRLIQKLNLPREKNRMPLVSATFNLQRLGEPLKFAGLETELVANSHGRTNFDLEFNATEIRGDLLFDCRYNENLFAAETIRRWLGHFQTLLENIATDPRQTLSSLSLLSKRERDELLNGSKQAGADFSSPACVHELFEEQARHTPETIAIAFEDRQLSYADLNRRANRLAHRLRALGVGPDVAVGLCLERSAEMVIGILAVLKAGGVYVPMEPDWPAERRAFILQDARAAVLLTQESLRGCLGIEIANFKVLCVEDNLEPRNFGEDENPQSGVRPENSAYVIYTSGSTGKPKGVVVTHKNVARLLHATQPWFQFNAQDVWTLFHSYAFDFSVWEIWGALIYGGKLVVVPYLTTRSPNALLDLLVREQVTVLNQTPSAFRQLMQADQAASPSRELELRYVIFGGEALDMRSLKPWFDQHGDRRPQLVNMYGITETTVHVTYRPIGVQDLESGSLIGVPIPDLQVYILDAQGEPVPTGVAGELHVGGAGVARGYLNQPNLTAEKFIPNPFCGDVNSRLYKTGDRARRLANGDIEFLGRIDGQVKIRGHRIELGEIEAAAVQHPAVRECVALMREDLPGDKRLAAYIVADPDKAEITRAELRNFFKTKLPGYMVPAAIVFLEKLPLTSNGKVDRKNLPVPEPIHPEQGEPLAAPSTPTENALAEIWREILQLERVGIHDDFVELGGHSLLMTQVLSRVRERFQVEVTVRQFFESPTIAKLSAMIEQLLAAEISQLSDDEARRLVHDTN